jgi:hypothetical protein
MPHRLTAGDTFYIRAPVKDPHLHVAAYHDPLKGLIVVNMTSDLRYEPTCVLNVGDHTFVTVKTLIAYEHARILTAYDCQQLEGVGIDRLMDPLSPELLERVQRGILDSKYTSKRMKAWVQEILNPPDPAR